MNSHDVFARSPHYVGSTATVSLVDSSSSSGSRLLFLATLDTKYVCSACLVVYTKFHVWISTVDRAAVPFRSCSGSLRKT